MPNCEIRKYFVALIKRIVLFSITLFFIITLLIGATTGFAKEDTMGLGIGTRSCTLFLDETIKVRDDGVLTDTALFKRLEYLQWANGFMTALNIRHYEKHNIFKKMNAVKKFQVLYGEIVNSCKYLLKNGKDDEFSIATFVVFHSLEKENFMEH